MSSRQVESSTLQRSDALAQTFFVDAGNFPQGYFMSSLDLFFEKKDAVLPVFVEIRPVYNGAPSSSEVLPFSEVTLKPASVNIPSNPIVISDIEATPTKCTFESPVHLQPGEYAIVINCNTDTYRLYLAQHGEKIYGGESVVKKQPYAGVFFKSQNGSTFTPDQKQDLMFRVRRCKFTTNTDYFAIMKTKQLTGDEKIGFYANGAAKTVGKAEREYETVRLMSHDLKFPDTTKLLYQYKSTPKSSNTIDGTYTDFIPNVDNDLSATRLLNANGSFTCRVTISTTDDRVSPVLDIVPKSKIFIVKNAFNNASLANNDVQMTNFGDKYNSVPTLTVSAPDISGGTQAVAVAVVNNASSNSIERVYFTEGGSGYVTTPTISFAGGNTTANVATASLQGETSGSGGNITARYITRRVTLDEEMEASNIRVLFDAFVHTTGGISVYFKAKHRDDPTPFDDVSYQRMSQRNTNITTTAKVNEFKEYQFRSDDPITYTGEDGSRYDKITSFAIKICMYGSNAAYPVKIKNFRAIAVD